MYLMLPYKRLGYAGIILISIFILIGCSADQEHAGSSEESKNVSAEKASEKKVKEIPKAAREIEEVVVQEPGKLVEEHIDPELEIIEGLDFVQYRNFIMDTFNPIVEKELTGYFENKQELTSDEVYDYLVYQLGSGQYKTYYQDLVDYEHGHVMPELPQGEDEVEKVKKQKQTNVVILMDASGSMKASVPGGVKMDLAKETIKKFTDQMEEDVNVSLLAYGHIGTGSDADKEESCSRIDAVYPLSSYNPASFNEAMNSFQASGWTPLAGAIDKAQELLASYNGVEYKNIVYIVSDGIETCDGDPIVAAKKLNESNIEAKVNIIGFDVDDEGQKQLMEVAEAGGGTYATVRDKEEFEELVLKKWKPTFGQLLSTQGMLLHDVVHQKQAVLDLYSPLYQSSERELNRISSAARFLKNEGFITEEVHSEVIGLAEEMRNLRNEHFRGIKDEKDAEAEKARNEINAQVQAWKDKWKEVLESEN